MFLTRLQFQAAIDTAPALLKKKKEEEAAAALLQKKKKKEEARAAQKKKKEEADRMAARSKLVELQELDKNISTNIHKISSILNTNTCFDDEVVDGLPNYFKNIREARDSIQFGGPFILISGDRVLNKKKNSALANVSLPTNSIYIENHSNALCLVCHKLLESTKNWEMRINSFKEWIESCDIDYTKTSRDGSTVFHMLATRRHEKSIEILKSILDVSKSLQIGRTASDRSSNTSSGVNILRSSDKKTALSLAIDNGFIDVATLLIQSGASYNEVGLLDAKYDQMDKWMGFVNELFQIRQNKACDDFQDIFDREPFSAPGVTVSDNDTTFANYYTFNEPSMFEYIKSWYKKISDLEIKVAANTTDAIPIKIELANAYVRFGVVCVRYPDTFGKSELETILCKYFELIKTNQDTFSNKIHPCMMSIVAHYYSHNQSDLLI